MPPSPSLPELLATVAAVTDLPALDAVEQEIFGRKHGVLTLRMKEIQNALPEQKKELGKKMNVMKQTLTEAVERRRKELELASVASIAETDRLDVTLELPKKDRGHLHLIPQFIAQVEEVFGRMWFEVAEGPEIETEENNFNLLNIPEDHPARDAQDTFWITDPSDKSKPASERFVLRTHTSNVQIRFMKSHTPPFRAIFPGKVYRKDADATHSPMFHQFEGLMIGKDVSLANMKSVMMEAIRELIAPTAEFRFRTGFFPFVEPGLEVDVRWQGDEEESREGRWIEIVGCGMVHPNVLRNCTIDPDEWQGFAFGFGVERMIMIKHQIPDLRLFYQGEPRFLKQF
ncbi:phenylalanine--tRNA ligase subunit alpha [Candidatus Peregrinibacteria bacterium]|nr:phenylalanine--tRNA ligase subunit alpha [Candidatus Peregrinibacteria bacterium]